MWVPISLTVLSLMQAASAATPQVSQKRFDEVLERASKEPDLDRAALILSSLLADESTFRSALTTSLDLDDRSFYILFGSPWSSRAKVIWKDRPQQLRFLVDSISAKPLLIRLVVRTGRYEAYLRSRRRRDRFEFFPLSRNPSAVATIAHRSFFESSVDADDLVETLIEALRIETTQPAQAVLWGDKVLVTAEEMEKTFLFLWQTVCGICDRLDLIDKVTTREWRSRFAELDKWFQENRPYVHWDNSKSSIRIDNDAKKLGRPTPRSARAIPELEPPWLPGRR